MSEIVENSMDAYWQDAVFFYQQAVLRGRVHKSSLDFQERE
jgi:hypothetical protein